MKEKIVISLVVLFLALGIVQIGYISKRADNEMEEEISNVTMTVVSLSAEIKEKDDEIDSLNERIDSLRNINRRQGAKINTLRIDVDGLFEAHNGDEYD